MREDNLRIKIFRDIEQRTDEWMQIKAGKTSGSSIKPLLSRRNDKPLYTYAYKLISQMEQKEPATYKGGFLSNAVQWGQDTEPEAIHEFEKKYNVIVEDVGWVEPLDPELAGFSGCSPDGIIDIYEWIEVKCLNSDTHVKYVCENKLPAEYEPQVVNYFTINPDLRKVYFILYDPRIKAEDKRMHVIEITRDMLKGKDDKLYDELVSFQSIVKQEHRKFLGEAVVV